MNHIFRIGTVAMSSISIHDLDPKIERKIKRLANQKHMSVNKTIKEILNHNFTEEKETSGNRRRFERFCGLWSEKEYQAFCSATEDFQTVDPGDWK
jgi:hypothetical protein